MANRYWVGGTGNWSDDTNHWATISGGSPGAGNKPTASDDAIFDSLSNTTAYTVTIDATAVCLNLNFSAAPSVSGTITWAGSSTMTISGSLTCLSGMTRTWTGSLNFNATGTGKTLTFNGVVTASSVTFNGSGGGWTVQDNWNNGSGTFGITNGTLNTNGKTITSGGVTINAGTKTLTLGASSWDCAFWNCAAPTNFTLNANTSTITQTGSGNNFTGGAMTYNNVTINGGGVSTISSANTFATLTLTGTAVKTDEFSLAADQICTTSFVCNGNSATNRVLVRSNTIGTARTITSASNTVTNADFKDITGAGAGSWNLSAITGGSGNCGGNTSITFTTPVNRYWVGNGGSWSSTTQWSASSGGGSGASVPLAQDTAFFDSSSFSSGSQTVTQNMPRIGAVNWTGVTNSPTWSTSTNCSIFGALTTVASMTWSASGGQVFKFENRSAVTFTTGGITATNVSVQMDAPGGGVTLSGAFTMDTANNRALTITQGTFNTNSNTLSVPIFGFNNTNTKTITITNSTVNITGTGNVWSYDSTGTTFNYSGSTIVVNNTTATAKTFNVGLIDGTTYNVVTFSGDNITVNGNNTYTTLNINTAGLTNGVLFKNGKTQTVTNFATNGSSGNLAKMVSTSAGSAATLSKSSGTVSVDYMSIKDSTATGGATFYAGANSTNVSGNTGWIFTAPPSTGSAALFSSD